MVHPLIETARSDYLDFYLSSLQQYRNTVPDLVPELLILLNGPPEWSEMHRLFRSDLIWKQDGQPKPGAVELNPPAPAPPQSTTHSGISITIDPFVWHWCQFLTDISPAGDALNDWFHKWIDDAETMTSDDTGLTGVIHQMTPVDPLHDAFMFSVDFGSAPVAAFDELLGVFSNCGITQLRIGSPDHQ